LAANAGFERFVAKQTSCVAERRLSAVCPTLHASLRDTRRCANLRSVGWSPRLPSHRRCATKEPT